MTYHVRILDGIIGKTITDISQTDRGLKFTVDGSTYEMYHEQDCCECVDIEDIVGDLEDLVGNPLLEAEEVSFNHPDELDEKSRIWNALSGASFHENDDSSTWTYYKFATIKGSVSIRWYGSSNGYYGESVDIVNLDKDYWDDDYRL